jgi:hypothetical protein
MCTEYGSTPMQGALALSIESTGLRYGRRPHSVSPTWPATAPAQQKSTLKG